MDQSTFNHGKSGDTNPKGRSRSPLLELYTRSLRNEREEKIGHRTSAACGGRLRLCYTLDEGKESERETTNCPPKRVRSRFRGHRGVRPGSMAGRTGAGAQREEVSTATGTTIFHTEAEWPGAQALGHSPDPRSNGADDSGVGLRTNSRG